MDVPYGSSFFCCETAQRGSTLARVCRPLIRSGVCCSRNGSIQPGGVLKRGGHTEAAVDLATLAGLSPVGVLCEITTKDGKDMARCAG